MDSRSNLTDSSHTSLNKAAHLLGINELSGLDYKSLNSIRKLSKTLGCNEFDLMKTFTSGTDLSSDANQTPQIGKGSLKELPKGSKSRKGSIDILRITETFKKASVGKESANIKLIRPGLTKKNSLKKKKNLAKQSSIELSKNTKKTLQADGNKTNVFKLGASLNPATIAKATNLTLSDKNINLNQLISSLTQKREVTLHKDPKLGFGFIAGSEKPLVIRFVTPGIFYFYFAFLFVY
jgi:hypothetical protein